MLSHELRTPLTPVVMTVAAMEMDRTLSPQQRAVLLLRDVFDYSVKETADALALSEPNVKTTHHRARRALEGYDRDRSVPTAATVQRSRDALVRFLQTLASSDVAASCASRLVPRQIVNSTVRPSASTRGRW